MHAITLEQLTRGYGKRRGVERITLSAPEGSLFGFLGPNGAGKTTTIRVLIGLLRPGAGAARVFGRDCWSDARRIKQEVGYLPGDLRLYSWLTGNDAVRLFGAIRGRDLTRGARDLAERFSLDMKVKVRQMSRGTRQKLGIVLALAHEPRLLILDEPTSGLDPLMQDRLIERLRELAKTGRTVFFSSHTLSEVEALCDRVAIVRDGLLVADEPLASLRARAGRHVSIRWREAHDAAGEPPSFLTLDRREGPLWVGTLEGPVGPLLEWLRARAIDDLSIGEPDLETLFRRYYRDAATVSPERERRGVGLSASGPVALAPGASSGPGAPGGGA